MIIEVFIGLIEALYFQLYPSSIFSLIIVNK